jgi:Glycosyl hydrolases family 39
MTWVCFCLAVLALVAGITACSHSATTSGSTQQPPPVAGSLTIAPLNPCIAPGGTQQFTATLTNVSGSGVNWSVDSVAGGNGTVGTISATGLYTAPSTSGQHTVSAVSQLDAKAAANTTIALNPKPGLSISPDSATILVSSQQTFDVAVCGTAASNTTWSVDGVPGGSDAAGVISSNGVYTAPAASGTHTIEVADTSMHTGKASATVSSGIAVDFGSRTDARNPIPAGILGINHADWFYAPAQVQQVAQAGFKLSRTYAKLSDIYPNQQPNWNAIDPSMARLQASGFHVLMQLAFTPWFLRSNLNACGSDPTKAAPSDVKAWAALAKSVVAHMDQKFPGMVTDYEIWNEPDSGGMCGTSNKLSTYLALYAATAPALKQQASADGASIRVGGPALSLPDPAWLQALLSNPGTAPYVDFVSYHQYFNATWDTVRSLTQDPTTGAAPTFAAAAQIVAAGKQPQPAQTPIYIDEFNTNWAFMKDCCRNHPTYAPVWNALYVSDILNTAYAGAPRLPGQLTYYAAVSLPYFCVVGDWNANMDCSHNSGAPVPYPQYYAYQLMASSSYLGMNDGGDMATSVSTLPAGRGLVATAFYTSKQDSILIANPTASTFSEIVRIENAGLSSPSAKLYQVVNGKSISSTSLKLTASGSAYTAAITVPPNTVLGIALR